MWFPYVYQVTCWATCRAKLYHPMDLSYWTAEQSHHNGTIDCGAVVPFSLGYSDWLTGSYHSYMLFSLDTILRCLSNVPFCSIPQHPTGGPKPALNLTHRPLP